MTPSGPVHGIIRPPGSKSLTNRALICAAMAQGTSQLEGALDSEDTRVMITALHLLGVNIEVHDEGKRLIVNGCGGKPARRAADLFMANSGTSMRFLTAMLAAVGGRYRLDGVPRMRQRPIGDLLEALRALGAKAQGEIHSEYPPVTLQSDGIAGGDVVVRGDASSQFLSALLMASPYAKAPLRIRTEGPLVSRPYVEMTVHVMERFGVCVQRTAGGEYEEFYIAAPTCYQPCRYEIEPDASAASYFWAAAAITGGHVLVRGLHRNSLQGDVAFCQCLQAMGCQVEESANGIAVRGGRLRGVDVDMNAISDTVLTLAVTALFAAGPTRIRNVAHIRHKETDRIADLARELRRVGAEVVEWPDGLEVHPKPLHPARIATYNDHRMAMSFALVGLRQPGIEIENPQCVEKTYPRFFEDLDKLISSTTSPSSRSDTSASRPEGFAV